MAREGNLILRRLRVVLETPAGGAGGWTGAVEMEPHLALDAPCLAQDTQGPIRNYHYEQDHTIYAKAASTDTAKALLVSGRYYRLPLRSAR